MNITLRRLNPALTEATKQQWIDWLSTTIDGIDKNKTDIDDSNDGNRIFATNRNDSDEVLASLVTIYNTLQENTLVPVLK